MPIITVPYGVFWQVNKFDVENRGMFSPVGFYGILGGVWREWQNSYVCGAQEPLLETVRKVFTG